MTQTVQFRPGSRVARRIDPSEQPPQIDHPEVLVAWAFVAVALEVGAALVWHFWPAVVRFFYR